MRTLILETMLVTVCGSNLQTITKIKQLPQEKTNSKIQAVQDNSFLLTKMEILTMTKLDTFVKDYHKTKLKL